MLLFVWKWVGLQIVSHDPTTVSVVTQCASSYYNNNQAKYVDAPDHFYSSTLIVYNKASLVDRCVHLYVVQYFGITFRQFCRTLIDSHSELKLRRQCMYTTPQKKQTQKPPNINMVR